MPSLSQSGARKNRERWVFLRCFMALPASRTGCPAFLGSALTQ
ncbi:hypothetical protein [Asaia sp. VD9]